MTDSQLGADSSKMILEESVDDVAGFMIRAQAGKSRRKRGQSFIFGEPHRIQMPSSNLPHPTALNIDSLHTATHFLLLSTSIFPTSENAS